MNNRTIFQRDEFEFWTSMKSRWNDMDGLRHINHATYLSYMETARLEYYEHLGYNVARWEAEVSTILAGMQIDYIQQTSHPTVIEIGQSITRVGTTSFDIKTAIFEKGLATPMVQGIFVMVAFNYETNKPIPVPEIFRKTR